MECVVVRSKGNDNEVSIHFTPTIAGQAYTIIVIADGKAGPSNVSRVFLPGI